MKSFVLRLTIRLAVAAAAFSLAAAAHAQDYPKRPITMIVPFAAGGTSDVIARVVAEEMTKSLGQPIVIENVAGAGGSTALTRAARAEADGYTIAIGNAGLLKDAQGQDGEDDHESPTACLSASDTATSTGPYCSQST